MKKAFLALTLLTTSCAPEYVLVKDQACTEELSMLRQEKFIWEHAQQLTDAKSITSPWICTDIDAATGAALPYRQCKPRFTSMAGASNPYAHSITVANPDPTP